jgi:hypothetical protein
MLVLARTFDFLTLIIQYRWVGEQHPDCEGHAVAWGVHVKETRKRAEGDVRGGGEGGGGGDAPVNRMPTMTTPTGQRPVALRQSINTPCSELDRPLSTVAMFCGAAPIYCV